MAKDVLFTNGIIAVREKNLLKDKIYKLCETGAEEALRALTESGFGKGVEISSVYEYETLVAADERAIDDFIREYAPSDAEAAYLLAPRDFHNAKALVKARYLGLDADKMLAPDGLIPASVIAQCIKDASYGALGKELGEAVQKAVEVLSGEQSANVSGADIGAVFDKAQYRHLLKACSKNPLLKKFIAAKADMTNILTALRSSDPEYAAGGYVEGGRLKKNVLDGIFADDQEKAARALDQTPYADFYAGCLEAKSGQLPLTAAERALDSYETEYFAAKKYELSKAQPFLYYVFRRRAENANVRILFVCLLAGMRDADVKKRLRSF